MGSGEAVRDREPSLVPTRGRDTLVGAGIRRGSTWSTQIPESGPSSVRLPTWASREYDRDHPSTTMVVLVTIKYVKIIVILLVYFLFAKLLYPVANRK